jgi:DNA-binding CsgD family transcriptional regulator
MEFKKEVFATRELEISNYLMQHLSLKKICEKTGLSKKIIAAHIRNMMKKLEAEDLASLKKKLR